MDDVAELIKKYWLTGVIALILVIFSIYVIVLNVQVSRYQTEYQTARGAVDTLNTEITKVTEVFDAEKEKNTIREASVSATDIGTRMINVDTILTSFYRSSAPFPDGISDDDRAALIKKSDDAKAEYRAITGLSTDGGINTWMLNPEWTLKLETILNYKSVDEVPVVFSMKTKDGRDAGLVQATYNVKENKLVNIVTYYTEAGMSNKSDPGGQ